MIREIEAIEIDITGLHEFAILKRVWDELLNLNSGPEPFLFRRGGKLVWLQNDSYGLKKLELLERDKLDAVLNLYFRWTRTQSKYSAPAKQPNYLAPRMLALPDPRLPEIEYISSVPMFSRTGELMRGPRFYQQEKVFIADYGIENIKRISQFPSVEEIAEAVGFLLGDLLGDFPFKSEADKANALGFLIAYFVRPMIEGVLPIHAIEANIEGTGKTYLLRVVSIVLTGLEPSLRALPDSETELRNVITSELKDGSMLIAFDNLRGRVNSAELASVTTGVYRKARQFHRQSDLEMPNRALWALTGNNLELTRELARRVVPIRLETNNETPVQEKTYRHENLPRWAADHRGEIIAAILTLVRASLSCLGSGFKVVRFPSFETYAMVLGRILHAAGVRGFLENMNEFREAADVESAEMEGFVQAWWQRHGAEPQKPGSLVQLADGEELLTLTLKSPSATGRKTEMGQFLQQRKNQIVCGKRISVARESAKKGRLYSLEEVK